MKRFYILLGLIAIVALIGIFKLKQSSREKVTNIVNEYYNEATMSSQITPLQALIDSGDSIKCTISKDLAAVTMTGDIYIDKNRIRADIIAPDKKGQLKESHTIIKDEMLYLWYDKNLSGFKMSLKQDQIQQATSSDYQYSGIVNSTIGTLDGLIEKCDSWELDEFMFAVPTTVGFIDGVGLMNDINTKMCNGCDLEETEASRLLCRQTLECK